MAFATRTLRDTVVNAAGAGGTVTILVNIEDDTTANNAILDASALDGKEKGSSTDVVQIRLAGTGHYDGSAGKIAAVATNATASSGDHEMTCFGTSGFVMIEFKKDENYTA